MTVFGIVSIIRIGFLSSATATPPCGQLFRSSRPSPQVHRHAGSRRRQYIIVGNKQTEGRHGEEANPRSFGDLRQLGQP